jgi:hypothetical protein
VGHTYDPNWCKASPGKSFLRSYLKKIKKTKKRSGGVAQGLGPEFRPQYHKKKSFPLCVKNVKGWHSGSCLALKRQREEDRRFQASLSYIEMSMC